jgi:hypothetical protein
LTAGIEHALAAFALLILTGLPEGDFGAADARRDTRLPVAVFVTVTMLGEFEDHRTGTIPLILCSAINAISSKDFPSRRMSSESMMVTLIFSVAEAPWMTPPVTKMTISITALVIDPLAVGALVLSGVFGIDGALGMRRRKDAVVDRAGARIGGLRSGPAELGQEREEEDEFFHGGDIVTDSTSDD